MKGFPQPYKVGANATRYRLSDFLIFEAERDGREPPQPDPARERYLSAAEVATRYGVSRATVWRWSQEARSQKEPAPASLAHEMHAAMAARRAQEVAQ
ncbi:MAG TPA: hypothetical protein VFQ88_05675 [Nevskiaceae bacterium]|nr:hypothetical protein [Nevskiaceae bacterium]